VAVLGVIRFSLPNGTWDLTVDDTHTIIDCPPDARKWALGQRARTIWDAAKGLEHATLQWIPERVDAPERCKAWSCDGRGKLPLCQLCPEAAVYWRNVDRPPFEPAPAPDPGFIAPPRERQWGLDWRRHRITWRPEPCKHCRKPALSLDDDGQPCHKACAELEIEQSGRVDDVLREQAAASGSGRRRRKASRTARR
jgi:hypothetical protein